MYVYFSFKDLSKSGIHLNFTHEKYKEIISGNQEKGLESRKLEAKKLTIMF